MQGNPKMKGAKLHMSFQPQCECGWKGSHHAKRNDAWQEMKWHREKECKLDYKLMEEIKI